MEKIKHKALTFDDVLLLPRFTDFLPAEAQLETKVSRNMILEEFLMIYFLRPLFLIELRQEENL